MALASVVALSLLPMSRLPEVASSVWDKAQHALGFAGLTALALWAWPRTAAYRPVLGLLVAGMGIEFAQTAVGWRHGDVKDVVADALGIAMGWAFVWVISAVRRRTIKR